jgi:hypothetical protein
MKSLLINIAVAIKSIAWLLAATRGSIAKTNSSYQYEPIITHKPTSCGLVYMAYEQFFHMDISYAFRYHSPIQTAIFDYNSVSINALCLNTHTTIIPYRESANSVTKNKFLL